MVMCWQPTGLAAMKPQLDDKGRVAMRASGHWCVTRMFRAFGTPHFGVTRRQAIAPLRLDFGVGTQGF